MEESQQELVAKVEQTTRTEPLIRQPAEPVGTGKLIFDVKNVSIYYSSFKAVTEVTMPIYENEITAFIGSSGSGKSTVLRGVQQDERPGARLPARRRDVLPGGQPLRS